MNESRKMRELIETINESFGNRWWDINCNRCGSLIAKTASSEPLPSFYCPSCADAEDEEDNSL